MRLAVVLAVAGAFSGLASAQDYAQQAELVLKHARIQAAFADVEENKQSILHEWAKITEINAPSRQEKERARYVRKLLKKAKLKHVDFDSAGNLIAVHKGTGGGPTVVVDAHLDTVFQPGLKIKAEIREGRIHAPGVGDNSRNIEAMLAMARAFRASGLRTRGDVIFLFTVEEESRMGGARHFVAENRQRIGHYIALDGGYRGFTYGSIGINSYRVHMQGPGGHTLAPPPPYSATLPLARTIARLYDIKLPDVPSTRLNVGMLGGSDVVNAKAADAWFSLDLRSIDNRVIEDLERQVAAIAEEEARRENMTARVERRTTRQAAQLPGFRDSRFVRTLEALHIAMGFTDPPISPTASNNASEALLAGVEAISTGTAPCGDAHALTEWCEIEPFYLGIKKLIAMTAAMAGLSD